MTIDGPAFVVSRPTFASAAEALRALEVQRMTPKRDGESSLAYIRRLAIAQGLIPGERLEREPGQEG